MNAEIILLAGSRATGLAAGFVLPCLIQDFKSKETSWSNRLENPIP